MWEEAYKPPVDTSAAPDRGFVANEYAFVSTKTFVRWLTGLFWGHILISVVFAVQCLLDATLFSELWVDEDLPANAIEWAWIAFSALAGLIYLPLFVITVVFYCLWISQANKNARALGAQGMEFTPGWAVGWWFVPIANLVKPYQAVSEVYKASDPEAKPGSWQFGDMPSLFGLWWAAWIIGNILSNIETRMVFSSDPDIVFMGAWLGVVANLIGIVAAYLAMKVVHVIHARQEQKVQGSDPPVAGLGEFA
jgi:hypothetical protein